jgi:hypothetical protein
MRPSDYGRGVHEHIMNKDGGSAESLRGSFRRGLALLQLNRKAQASRPLKGV